MAAKSPRQAAQKAKDVREAVQKELEFDPLIDASDISVKNMSGDVALNGTVPAYPQYLQAAAAAKRVQGVTRVHNHLMVDVPYASYRDDVLLTTDANNALAMNVSVPPGSVEASASEGNVWLTGMVGNRFQRDAAEQAVARLRERVASLAAKGKIEASPAPEPGRSRSSIGYLNRQLTRWSGQWQRNQTREQPAFGQLTRWLTEEMGRLTSDYPSTFVHGDYRLDNLILDPSTYQVRAVLDWEMSTFGDPLMDLALLLAYWEQPGDVLRQRVNVARNLTVAPGFWSRDRLLSEYLAATGVPDEHLTACLGLTCLKLATIMEGIHHRHQAGPALDDLSAGLGAMKDILSLMVTHRGYVRVFFEHHRELPPEAKRYVTAQRDAYESLRRR